MRVCVLPSLPHGCGFICKAGDKEVTPRHTGRSRRVLLMNQHTRVRAAGSRIGGGLARPVVHVVLVRVGRHVDRARAGSAPRPPLCLTDKPEGPCHTQRFVKWQKCLCLIRLFAVAQPVAPGTPATCRPCRPCLGGRARCEAVSLPCTTGTTRTGWPA